MAQKSDEHQSYISNGINRIDPQIQKLQFDRNLNPHNYGDVYARTKGKVRGLYHAHARLTHYGRIDIIQKRIT